MTPEQRLVHAVNLVRQEVGSGGFEAYFAWTNGISSRTALEGFEQLAPPAGLILREALTLREAHEEPDFSALDGLFNVAEARLMLDQVVDRYVADNPTGFYR
jgi:hypothetical protein